MAIPWSTTNLQPGPLSANTYNWTITSLSASTIYEYRAYFMLNGVAFYGNILTGTTLNPPPIPPTVNTGVAQEPTAYSIFICNSSASSIGDSPIVEYGLLYAQIGSCQIDTNLIYSNYPAFVKKSSTCSSINAGVNFNNAGGGLSPNTATFYRAFAKNASGIGYGHIQCQQTT